MSRRYNRRPDPRRRARDDEGRQSREAHQGPTMHWERNNAEITNGVDRLIVEGRIVGHVQRVPVDGPFDDDYFVATIFPTNTVTEIKREEFGNWDDARLAVESAAAAHFASREVTS